jgi:hypothetical protein
MGKGRVDEGRQREGGPLRKGDGGGWWKRSDPCGLCHLGRSLVTGQVIICQAVISVHKREACRMPQHHDSCPLGHPRYPLDAGYIVRHCCGSPVQPHGGSRCLPPPEARPHRNLRVGGYRIARIGNRAFCRFRRRTAQQAITRKRPTGIDSALRATYVTRHWS